MAYTSFVAVGDSFTEGLNDIDPATGAVRGWADRVAARLAEEDPGLRYANLAVRGKLLRQIVTEQVPRAVEMRPDLVTFVGGGNDILRPGCDPDALAVTYDAATARLRGTGADVVIFTGFDMRDVPVLRRIRAKAAVFNLHLRSIADRHGCRLVDLWSARTLLDPRAFSIDRVHLSPEGHRRVALVVCEALGVPAAEDWREPWPAQPRADWLATRRGDVEWARAYLLPWVRRRLARRSSGDGVPPKRPELVEVSAAAAEEGA